jgi:hypothetical protein
VNELSLLPLVQCSAVWKILGSWQIGYVSCGSMNDGGHSLLSPVLFSHISDSSTSTKTDVLYKVLYMKFRGKAGGPAIPGFKQQILRIYRVFSLLD